MPALGRVQLHHRRVELAFDDERDDAQALVDRFLDQRLLFLARAVQHEVGHGLLRVLVARVPDAQAQAQGCSLSRETRFQALAGRTRIAGQEVWLLEPQTFMNRSGQSVGALARFYKIAADEVLVVHDELDLAPGVAKLKKGGSSGGHNGLKDITAALGTPDYWRLRIGIGHPRQLNLQQAVVDFVLHRPRREEQLLIDEAIAHSLDVVPTLCEGKFEAAMLKLHTTK